jgi:hypothetical protein
VGRKKAKNNDKEAPEAAPVADEVDKSQAPPAASPAAPTPRTPRTRGAAARERQEAAAQVQESPGPVTKRYCYTK